MRRILRDFGQIYWVIRYRLNLALFLGRSGNFSEARKVAAMGVKLSVSEVERVLAQPGYSVAYGELPTNSAKRNKFGAVRVKLDDMTFDSKAEMARWGELRLLELSGRITDLEFHPVYILTAGVRYEADFRYIEAGGTVVEDVKGGKATQTQAFRNKWKQVKVLYPDVEFRLVEK